MSFDYPDILRQPAGDVLTRFAGVGADVHLYWYAMFASALGIIPAAVGMGLLTVNSDRFLASITAVFGVLAGLVQALGLLRWVMLVPSLAAAYVAPGASELDRALAASAFDVANHYLGMGVGEHMGYFFTALWTAGLSLLLWNRWRILSAAGLLIALGVVAGMAEPFGVPLTGVINAISFSVWALWALVVGVMVLRKAPTPEGMPQAA